VGLIDTYARWKGHDVFLEAAARLANIFRERPLRFYIVGGPIYQTRGSQYDQGELREMARRLGIADRVGFVDFQVNVVPVYRALDVVVHASTTPEPFGLTIIEAMACGKPVVASLAGGVADIIQTSYDAIGVSTGDEEGLVGAIRMLLENSQLRAELGVRARQTVCEKFAQDRVGPQMLELYRVLTALPQLSSSNVKKVFMHP
jgi:glycosyltransferase involved in cell wall biosynthesis